MKFLTKAIFIIAITLTPALAEALPINHQTASRCVSRDCRTVAQALYFEARGEGIRGMQAVANVIHNRATARNLSHHYIVNERNQFSYRSRRSLHMSDRHTKMQAHAIAYNVIQGRMPDITGGAFFFRTVRSGSFGRGYVRTARIGNHHFFKLRDGRTH